MIRGANPSYLLLLVVLIGGMLGYLHAISETVEVVVREKRVEQGETRRGLPVDVHDLLTDRGPLPISRLALTGYFQAAEVLRRHPPGRRHRMRLASWPRSGDRMSSRSTLKAQAN